MPIDVEKRRKAEAINEKRIIEMYEERDARKKHVLEVVIPQAIDYLKRNSKNAFTRAELFDLFPLLKNDNLWVDSHGDIELSYFNFEFEKRPGVKSFSTRVGGVAVYSFHYEP